MRLLRLIEEIAPHVAFYCVQRKIKTHVGNQQSDVAAYQELPEAQLTERLEEEGDRSVRVNDKTVRVAGLLTLGFAFLGLAGPRVVTAIDCREVDLVLGAMGFLAALYLLDAAYLVFGAMRTVERYGFGTHFRIELHNREGKDMLAYLALTLWRQERANLVLNNRNAVVFTTLRNALILIVVSTIVAGVTLLIEHVS